MCSVIVAGDPTNGKWNAFHRKLADSNAYTRLYASDDERCAECPRWLHTYDQHGAYAERCYVLD
ncbi:hypothetical protein GCM10027535_55260 [Mycolicibacterium hippocampi]|uniref:Uncharacterized protein n=1 Tax=Mycolicibacterium hippocampi TaxID=659824 RepID=A0A7I9ZMQ0_9MYCO|nr:hypothetical protein MHIP_24010 [Mycolicibacterium hippocampi]